MPGKHSGFKMYGKSPMMKKLIGGQGKLDKNKDGNSKSPLEMYSKAAPVSQFPLPSS